MRDIQMVLERWGHGRQVVTPGGLFSDRCRIQRPFTIYH